MRAKAALPTVDELLFGLLLVGVSGSAGADGLISAGIVSRLCVCVCVAQFAGCTQSWNSPLRMRVK